MRFVLCEHDSYFIVCHFYILVGAASSGKMFIIIRMKYELEAVTAADKKCIQHIVSEWTNREDKGRYFICTHFIVFTTVLLYEQIEIFKYQSV